MPRETAAVEIAFFFAGMNLHARWTLQHEPGMVNLLQFDRAGLRRLLRASPAKSASAPPSCSADPPQRGERDPAAMTDLAKSLRDKPMRQRA